MNNNFGEKMRELRDKKFPGQGLRRVCQFFSSVDDFGNYFFTQLSKMEAGVILPSPNLLLKIMNAYKANDEERQEIFTAYSYAVTFKKMTQVDQFTKTTTSSEVINILHRRLKKK